MKTVINTIIEESVQEILDGMDKHVEDIHAVSIYGSGGIFDSMGLVSLIVILEEKIQDAFDISLLLANEKALSRKNSPFKNTQRIADYICSLMPIGEAHA